MKITRYAPALLCAVLLAACSEQQQEAVKKTAADSFRNEFTAAFIQACLERIPQEAGLSAELAQKICVCSADKAVETVSVADMPKLIQGDAELTRKAMEAAKACKDEVFGNKVASAASAASAASGGN